MSAFSERRTRLAQGLQQDSSKRSTAFKVRLEAIVYYELRARAIRRKVPLATLAAQLIVKGILNEPNP